MSDKVARYEAAKAARVAAGDKEYDLREAIFADGLKAGPKPWEVVEWFTKQRCIFCLKHRRRMVMRGQALDRLGRETFKGYDICMRCARAIGATAGRHDSSNRPRP